MHPQIEIFEPKPQGRTPTKLGYPALRLLKGITRTSDRKDPKPWCKIRLHKEAIDFLNIKAGDRIRVLYFNMDHFAAIEVLPSSKANGYRLGEYTNCILEANPSAIATDDRYRAGVYEILPINHAIDLNIDYYELKYLHP